MQKIFVILFVLCCFQCQKEEVTERNYPRVRTLAIENVTTDGAAVQGKITYTNTAILDHGFVWSTTESLPDIETSDIISLGSKPGTGTFEASINHGLAKDVTYFVRAYARSADHIVYGDLLEFQSMGSMTPQPVSLSPSVAHWGDTLILRGKNFSKRDDFNVAFDNINAVTLTKTDTLIKFIVPDDMLEKESSVSVKFDGKSTAVADPFQLLTPEIETVDPSHGAANATIYIYGKGFNQIHSEVFFGTTAASIFTRTHEYIRCTVPNGLPKGALVLKVHAGENSLDAQTSFTID